MRSLLNVLNLEFVIGVVFAALLSKHPLSKRNESAIKIDSTEAQATALEEATVQRTINRVKLVLESAEKEQTGSLWTARFASSRLVSDQTRLQQEKNEPEPTGP